MPAGDHSDLTALAKRLSPALMQDFLPALLGRIVTTSYLPLDADVLAGSRG